MAYVCYDCQIIFPSMKANCPLCGGRVFFDDRSESILKGENFTVFSPTKRQNEPKSQENNDFRIDDSDIFSSLRQSYENEHRRTKHQSKSSSDFFPTQGINQPTTQNSIPTVQQENKTPVSVAPSGGDFFSRFEQANNPAANVPTVNVPTVERTHEQNRASYLPIEDDSEDELQTLRRQQRRIQNNYRRAAFADSLRNINWQLVFRIILIIAVVLAGWAIWRIRYQILESVYNFIISLVPLFIIVAIIMSFFKSNSKK